MAKGMAFDELLERIRDDYLNPVVLPDGTKQCDCNGHTRLADLQAKYDLSSLKIQKLLVTAGVYQPVKVTSSYYAIKQLYGEGRSMEEIVQELGLSKAVVNASIPYERGAKELDKLGVKITGDAARKRKQRSNDEMKKDNARDILSQSMSDEALWNALDENYSEAFLTASGQRFLIVVVYGGDDKPELCISLIPHKGHVYIPQADVFAAYHRAIEEKAGEMAENAEKVGLGEYDEYLRPLFIYLGVLDGDRAAVTTKRNVPEDARCACCGRRTDKLYSVSTFEDLVDLDIQFEEERKAAWSEDEKQRAQAIDFMMKDEQAYWAEKKKKMLEAARTSKAVESFNAEGERKFCKLCCQTIYGALEEGVYPPVKRIDGYDEVSDDELISFIQEECVSADCDYYHVSQGILKAELFDNESLFLYKVLDKNGVEHSFALSTFTRPYADGDMGLSFRAFEVHKLTKAKKISTDNTGTDYEVNHFKICPDGDDLDHAACVGLVELIERIITVVRTETLSESRSPASNLITVNGHHYGINSMGTIIPTYVGDAGNYRSMRGREWDGDDYGFLIDGKLFSGPELALMFSCHEGAQIKFYADDPSSKPLRDDEMLMAVRLTQQDLVDDTIELINMFSSNGKFEREKDRENFGKLFERDVLEKLKLYHMSRPRGYGKLAGMEINKRLERVKGLEGFQEAVMKIIR